MRYYGELLDRQGRTIAVEIVTHDSSDETVMIGEDASGVWFAAEEAVTTEGQNQDLFNVILQQSATIRLEVENFIQDLYNADFRDAVVQISLDGVPVFRGFVLPRTFSQGFTQRIETLEINCVDRLSALQWIKWQFVGSDEAGYDALKGEAGPMKALDIIRVILEAIGVNPEDVVNQAEVRVTSPSLTWWEDVLIPTVQFFGATMEDAWTCDEVVKQILQYFNLHIEDNGDKIKIFHWDRRKSAQTKTITASIASGTDTQISIPEIYNKISVRCESEVKEDVVPDMLSSGTCTSPFNAMQLYCTEYSLLPSTEKGFPWGHLEDSDAFGQMVSGEDPSKIFSDLIFRRDYWVRALQSKGWKLYGEQNASATRWDGVLPFSTARPLWGASEFASGTYMNRIFDSLSNVDTFRGAAALLNLTTGSRYYKATDRNDMGGTSSASYLAIGTPGSATAYNKERDNLPKVVYTGEDVTLSPLDSSTTRWLDISGSITLVPSKRVVNDSANVGATFKTMTRQQFQDYIKGNLRLLYKTDKEERIFTRSWYNSRHPSPLASGVSRSSWQGLDLPCAEDMVKTIPHRGRKLKFHTSSGYVDLTREFRPVPVLRCMLIVGDKCAVEYWHDGIRSFRWETYNPSKVQNGDFSQSFSLSMDVKADAHVVGEEHRIAQTVDYTKLLDLQGMAIPIKAEDKVSGKVTFLILGRTDLWFVNGEYMGEASEAVKFLSNTKLSVTGVPPDVMPYASTMPENNDTHPYFEKIGSLHSSVAERVERVFSQVSAIWLKDFKIKILTDNAQQDPLTEKDIVYVSEDSSGFTNFKEETTFKIMSALTSMERKEFGVSDHPGQQVPTVENGNPVESIKTNYSAHVSKPEEVYVDWFYREYSTPHLEVEQGIRCGSEDPMLSTYALPALPGKKFCPMCVSRDLQDGSARIIMREVK